MLMPCLDITALKTTLPELQVELFTKQQKLRQVQIQSICRQQDKFE